MFVTHYIEFHSTGRKSNSVISEYCSFYHFTNTFQSVDYYFSTAVNCTVISTPCITPCTTVIFKLCLLRLSCSFVVWCGIYFHLCIYSCMSVRILYLCITNLFFTELSSFISRSDEFYYKELFSLLKCSLADIYFFPYLCIIHLTLSILVLYFLKKLRYLTSPSVFFLYTDYHFFTLFLYCKFFLSHFLYPIIFF